MGYTIETSVPSGAKFTDTTYTGATLKTAAAKTGSGNTFTSSIAKSTTIDAAIGTLLNNEYALNGFISYTYTSYGYTQLSSVIKDIIGKEYNKNGQSKKIKAQLSDGSVIIYMYCDSAKNAWGIYCQWPMAYGGSFACSSGGTPTMHDWQ